MNLTAVRLNGVEFVVPLANASGATLAEELQADDTRGYILKVPLSADVVTQQVGTSPASSFVPSQDSLTLSCFLALQRRGRDALQSGRQLHTDRLA